jgi:hypothetical protein
LRGESNDRILIERIFEKLNFMDVTPLLTTFSLIALAEMGDKTQLSAITLVYSFFMHLSITTLIPASFAFAFIAMNYYRWYSIGAPENVHNVHFYGYG